MLRSHGRRLILCLGNHFRVDLARRFFVGYPVKVPVTTNLLFQRLFNLYVLMNQKILPGALKVKQITVPPQQLTVGTMTLSIHPP